MNKRHTLKVRSEAEAELGTFSMYAFLPILKYFNSVKIHPCVDLYAIFRPKPMYIFVFGIGKMMKECFIDMLGVSESVSIAMRNGQHVAK